MILVTGGTGLVGSHLLYYLSLSGHSVRATFRTKSKLDTVKHVFSYYSENHETLFNTIEWTEASLNDIPKLTDAFKDVTTVYHCAASVTFDPNRYHELRKVNIEGTANIVNLCVANHVKKLCYVSSIAAVGDDLTGAPATEKTSWNPEADNNIYGITKHGAEMEVWRGTQEGVDAVVVNPGVIIGPGFWRTSSGSLIKRIHKGVNYYTTGVTGYIDIHDVIKCMIQLMESTIKNERYILVADHLSIKEFVEKVAVNLQVKPPKREASRWLLQIAWRLDWLSYFFKRKYRRLTKHNVRSLTSNSYYNNDKIRSTIGMNFKPLDISIRETCSLFLKDLS